MKNVFLLALKLSRIYGENMSQECVCFSEQKMWIKKIPWTGGKECLDLIKEIKVGKHKKETRRLWLNWLIGRWMEGVCDQLVCMSF